MRRFGSFCSSALRFFSYTKAKSQCDLRPRRAYVVFGSVDLIWPHRFLARGFKHCYVFWESEGGLLQLSAAVNIATVSWLGKDITVARYIHILKRLGCRVVECTIKPDRIATQYIPRVGAFNCVSLTKLALGIKPFGVYTPKQLFNYLMKRHKGIDMGGGDDASNAAAYQEQEQQKQDQREQELEAQEQAKNQETMENQLKQMRRFRGGAGGAQGGSNPTLGG